jgi:hypothetical protein
MVVKQARAFLTDDRLINDNAAWPNTSSLNALNFKGIAA